MPFPGSSAWAPDVAWRRRPRVPRLSSRRAKASGGLTPPQGGPKPPEHRLLWRWASLRDNPNEGLKLLLRGLFVSPKGSNESPGAVFLFPQPIVQRLDQARSRPANPNRSGSRQSRAQPPRPSRSSRLDSARAAPWPATMIALRWVPIRIACEASAVSFSSAVKRRSYSSLSNLASVALVPPESIRPSASAASNR